MTLFPASAATLDASRVASLAMIPDGQSKDDGIAVGEAAAAALLALRSNDRHARANPERIAPLCPHFFRAGFRGLYNR